MKLNVQKRGFTLVEVMVTLALSFLVFAALLTVYHWSAQLMTLCGKKNRSQVAAINSSVRIMDCVRNASQISDIDTNDGRWVKLSYSDGSTMILAYTNSPDIVDSGALGVFQDGKDPIWLVRNGITEMMSDQGFDGVVFSTAARTNLLYVRYRVSQPADDGGRDLNDGAYATHVRFATCLRNAE